MTETIIPVPPDLINFRILVFGTGPSFVYAWWSFLALCGVGLVALLRYRTAKWFYGFAHVQFLFFAGIIGVASAHVVCLHADYGLQDKLIEFILMLSRFAIELGALGFFVLLLRIRHGHSQQVAALPLFSSFVVLLTAALHWLFIIIANLAIMEAVANK